MRQKNFAPFRERVVGTARGHLLDIGIGPSLNLASYRPCAEEVYGVDPSTELVAKASNRLNTARIPVKLFKGSGEKIAVRRSQLRYGGYDFPLVLHNQTLPSPYERCDEC